MTPDPDTPTAILADRGNPDFLTAFDEIAAIPGPAAMASALLDDGPGDLQAVFDVPVKVQAVLGRARMPIGDLLRLRSGMVVELDRKVGEPVDIFVNDRLIARGEVVLIEDMLGITLTEIVQPDP